ncbi:MAG: putative glycolipid-binding domain-containing protein [Acidisphaera sp.]|nr:putative glycolipid-binding domain-containing protein [Acidisphaera sp.]
MPHAGLGAEHLVLRETAEGVVAEAVVIGAREGTPFGLRYRLACDARWRVREAAFSLVGEERRLDLRADGEGNWRDGGGQAVAALQGCVDIDVSATPFTNTLPIRRLGLAPQTAVDIIVAYVAVPALTVASALQRYTCLETGRRYRYEGPLRRFTAELCVDQDGLVLDYPGLFRRA